MLRGGPASAPARVRRAREARFLAPTAGWVTNRNIAQPGGQGQGAELLENFFPTARSTLLRRGSRTYAQLGDGSLPVATMFKYVVGSNRRLFAATQTTIYDITLVTQAYNYSIGLDDEWTLAASDEEAVGENSTGGMEVREDTVTGDWSTVQFSTTGGVFLIGVNGASTGFIYDGTAFHDLEGDADPSFPGVTFPDGSTLTTANLAYVWAYKNRLWFVQRDSLSVFYLPVDQIGGQLTELRLGSEFGRGGAILFGQTWSLSAGGEGGLSEQIVFVSTEGEVLVYQGSNPALADDFRKVGTYRIGAPLGRKAMIRAGGDLVIATNVGFIALSQAVQVDFAALAPSAVSYAIETAWNAAVQQRGNEGWSCVLWPEQQMVVVAPPPVGSLRDSIFVSNSGTAAWCNFTNWRVTCMETFNGRLLFGSEEGIIKDAMVGGSDDGVPYTGAYVPLFSDEGTPASLKAAKMARSSLRSSTQLQERVSCRFDFDTSLPPPPNVVEITTGNEWDNAVWDQSIWDSERPSIISHRRASVSGAGYRIAPAVQVTSGSVVPIDAEIISLEVTYEVGGSFV